MLLKFLPDYRNQKTERTFVDCDPADNIEYRGFNKILGAWTLPTNIKVKKIPEFSPNKSFPAFPQNLRAFLHFLECTNPEFTASFERAFQNLVQR